MRVLSKAPHHRFSVFRAGRDSALACLLAAGAACVSPSESEPALGPEKIAPHIISVDPPSAPASLAPQLSPGPLLSWLEPGEEGHALRFSRLESAGWSEPQTVARGESFFANWADVPSVVEQSNGSLLAHWLERLGEDTYSYGVRLTRSRDRGKSWTSIGWLHQDRTEAEHGFVSLLSPPPEDFPSHTWAFWLDGRGMPQGGPMTLRGKEVGLSAATSGLADASEGAPATSGAPNDPADSLILDPRVCECCQTDAAWSALGPVVVYRGRSQTEVRDIRWVRRSSGGWSEPRTLAEDDWRIAGCPVNGPAIAASGQEVAVAWFTGAQDRPRVQVVFSNDGADTFSQPIEIDGDRPLGRVDIAHTGGDEFAVSWLASTHNEASGNGASGDSSSGNGASEDGAMRNRAQIRVRWVRSQGGEGPTVAIADTVPSRAAGVPRLVRQGDDLIVTWVDTGGSGKIRAVRVDRGHLVAPH